MVSSGSPTGRGQETSPDGRRGAPGWTSPDPHYELGIWGRNLFDTTNISDIIPIEGLSFDLFSMAKPRTYGIYVRYNY